MASSAGNEESSGGGGSSSSNVARLRIAGAWSGEVEVCVEEWTIDRLCRRVAEVSGVGMDSINLICGGKNLRSHDQRRLTQVGVRPNSKLLMTRIGKEQAAPLIAEKERVERLARIKAAADAMAKRSNEDAYPADVFDIQLENQSGENVRLHSESDRRALVMGLMLHAKARNILQEGHYLEALEVFDMAEEAFSLCNAEFLKLVDNVALLQIDIVWCYFMLKDITRLSVAGKRLSQAREGLLHSHGPQLERLRVLQGGFCPEIAIYVRLELLEGVIAFYCGDLEIARRSLTSANNKYRQLQVSDDSLALLAGMGFSTKKSRRALRISGQDLHRAIDFLMEERRKESEKAKEDVRHEKMRREQKLYGKTSTGKAVDIGKVDELTSIGYARSLVAEALRRTENDIDAALDLLTDPVQNCAIQSTLCDLKRKRHKKVDEQALSELTAMGFQKEKVIQALLCTEDKGQALERLLQGTSSTTDAQASSGATQDALSESASMKDTSPLEENSSTAHKDDTSPPESSSSSDKRDEDMENDIAKNLTGDSLAEYDIEVEKEGEAILQYLSMLDATIATH